MKTAQISGYGIRVFKWKKPEEIPKFGLFRYKFLIS